MMVEGVERRSSVDGEDMISNLPDPLIHHILSFLDMKHVVMTCLLSRRWRHLWRSVPVLDFGYFSCRGSDPAAFIGRSLTLYEGRKVQRFSASLLCEVAASEIDSWIQFATRHDVEELDMILFSGYRDETIYKMPPCLLDCGALRVLRLTSCDLTLHASSFCFRSLTKLRLCDVEMTDLDTSGCPLLEKIVIRNCDNSLNINICAPNQRLRCLKITDSPLALKKKCGLTIYAPNVLSIEFGYSLRQFYNIKNLSSITTATFDLENMSNGGDWYAFDYPKLLVDLLKSLSHAKTLKLSIFSIRALGRGQRNNLKMPSLAATCLELETSLTVEQPIGIGSLLRSSSCLETLIINISTITSIYGPTDYWAPLEHVLSAGLQLKTVKICNLLQSSNRFWGEPKSSRNLDKILERSSGQLKLVKLLLGGCMMLDKMIISTTEDIYWPSTSEFLLGLEERILALPRGSSDAEIHVFLHPALLP